MRTLWGVLFCLTANTSEKLRCTLEDRESWQILFTCQELKCDVRVFATSVHWTCYFCETYSLNPRVIEQWNYLSFSWSQILQYEFAKAVRSALLYLHVSKWNHLRKLNDVMFTQTTRITSFGGLRSDWQKHAHKWHRWSMISLTWGASPNFDLKPTLLF